MLAACFKPATPDSPAYGRADGGLPVYASFRPSVAELAYFLTPHLDGKATVADALPLPKGMRIALNPVQKQLQLFLSETFARRMRKVYGHIGEIKLGWFLLAPPLLFLAIFWGHWRGRVPILPRVSERTHLRNYKLSVLPPGDLVRPLLKRKTASCMFGSMPLQAKHSSAQLFKF